MKTEVIKFVVQYKSVYAPDGPWIDYERDYLSIQKAIGDAKSLLSVNPNVRLIKRAITETIVEL